ncbi:flagellar basal body P-ring formation chaperone FlgA [Solimonas marina]|uniref:Flagella basal body P-ring formation protein FlgA n=1 Tax=Solimonas marina TaxID=2714601 RepID=A0A969W8B0_9GAMM|nr:flagellar basal body P-ring formation chaperone FlgA [Solimonas marina]NKF21749.1 flagellar basal body P-ring formation protein FlgA [Solimonas marina]
MKLFRQSLLLLSALATSLPALAQDASESLDRIRAVAEAAVRQSLPASADVSADGIDTRLRLPACGTRPQAESGPIRGAATSVNVRCEKPSAWSIYVPVRIKDIRPVLVLTRAVQRGEAVTPDLLRPEQRDVATLPFGYLVDPDKLAQSEFRRPIGAGQALSPTDVQPERCVRRGELVMLIGRAAGIEVRAEGKALADGGRGSRIRVQNTNSRRIVEGTITGPGRVEM